MVLRYPFKTLPPFFAFATRKAAINAISPHAVIEPSAQIEKGIIVSAGCIVSHGVTIGNNTYLDSGVIVDIYTEIG